MAVEYIDSPNAGFIKLGEGVGLETITPQRKRKVKRGDRGVFPITPTGAESYEETDFTAQQGFTTPASAIPNVFDRYKDLPGGARAGGFPGGSFENVISPGIGNQNDDANDDDADLEEELRRQSLDIDPFGDYALDRDGNPIDTGPDLKPGQVGYETLKKLNNALDNFFEKAGKKRSDSVPEEIFDFLGALGPTTSTGGGGRGATNVFTDNKIFDADTGFTGKGGAPTGNLTDIPKVGFGSTGGGAPTMPGGLLGAFGGSSAPAGAIPSGLLDTGAGGAPTVSPIGVDIDQPDTPSAGPSVPQGGPDLDFDVISGAEAPQGGEGAQGGPSDPGGTFGGFATSVDSPDGLLSVPGQGFNRGGKISFMNIKK